MTNTLWQHSKVMCASRINIMPKAFTNTHSNGFTLIELVVALAIFAIMAAIAYSGLNNVLLARDQTDTNAQQLYQLQLAVNWISRDVEQIVNRGIRSEYGEPQPPVVGNELEGYVLELTHTGWRNPANRARSSLQRVAYEVRDEKLIRAYWRVLDRAEDSKPLENVLLTGVKGVEIRYLGADDEWHTSWPDDNGKLNQTNPQPTIPRGIEVNIDTRQFGKITRLLRTGR